MLQVEILSKLRHPNIVSYKESFQTENGSLAIVMGYCEGGDLYTKLKKQAKCQEYLTEAQIVEWFVQIAMALQVCYFSEMQRNFSTPQYTIVLFVTVH